MLFVVRESDGGTRIIVEVETQKEADEMVDRYRREGCRAAAVECVVNLEPEGGR